MKINIKLVIILVFTLFVFSDLVQAATVTGKLYDKDFNLLKNSIVEINTFPKQTYVAKDGKYSFTLTSGRFMLTAFHKLKNGTIIFATKNVLMASAGIYNVDIILNKPYNGQDLPTELNQPLPLFGINPTLFYTTVSIMIIIIFLLAFFLFKKHRHSIIKGPNLTNDKDDIAQFIDEIKKEGNRITQKDLRNKFQKYSEAKVSLVISEMESKGLIDKIKKGRGNIIILKKQQMKNEDH